LLSLGKYASGAIPLQVTPKKPGNSIDYCAMRAWVLLQPRHCHYSPFPCVFHAGVVAHAQRTRCGVAFSAQLSQGSMQGHADPLSGRWKRPKIGDPHEASGSRQLAPGLTPLPRAQYLGRRDGFYVRYAGAMVFAQIRTKRFQSVRRSSPEMLPGDAQGLRRRLPIFLEIFG
jgi:hypothetical protein